MTKSKKGKLLKTIKSKKEAEDIFTNERKKYRSRWIGRKDLILRIIEKLRDNDSSWIYMIPRTAEFADGPDLRGILFTNVDLRDINFGKCDLRYADLSGSDLRGSDLQYTDLRGTDLSNIIVDDKIDWGTYFARFLDKRKSQMSKLKYLWTQRIYRYFGYKGKIISERKSKKYELLLAKDVYRYLRIAYRSNDPTVAAYFYYRETHCERVLHPRFHPVRLIGFIWEKISCYGTAPLRVLLILGIVILAFALIYLYYADGITRERNGMTLGIRSFGEAVYFSAITYTSLAFSDFRPNLDHPQGRILKYVCAIEALLGIISISLLASIFLKFMSK